MQKEFSKILSQNKALIALILVGSLSWVLTMIKSGLPSFYGISFWGANGHDGIWHLALAQSLGRGNLQMPTFAGNLLQNYHIGFDLLLISLEKVTSIPISIWYFQLLPILFSLSTGILTYLFVVNWKNSKNAALWSTFFVYFGGDFGYIVTLLRGNGLGGESMFWSQQAVSSLINPPFALSLIFLLLGLVCIKKYLKNPSLVWLLLCSILFGLLAEIKIYAGILTLGALCITSLQEIYLTRSFSYLKVFLCSLLISAILFLPLNAQASSVLVFQPFWFLETMLALSDRFYWPRLYEALINWRSAHTYPKAIIGYGVALGLFIIGNLGTRLTSLILVSPKPLNIRRILQSDSYTVLLVSIAIGGFAFPLIFVQQGTAWNTIQFFYYTLFVMAIFAGIGVQSVLQKISSKNMKRFAVLALILFTIPTSISTLLQVYIPSRPPAHLPSEEIEALSFLKKQPAGIVLTYPFDPVLAKEAVSNPPRPLYLYESSAYVSAFSNKSVFLEDEVNLTIMGYQWKNRMDEIEQFYKTQDQLLARTFLHKNAINYIYWVKPQRATIGDLQLGLENIFENKKVVIYRVLQ